MRQYPNPVMPIRPRPARLIRLNDSFIMDAMDTPLPLTSYRFTQSDTADTNAMAEEMPVLLDISQQSTRYLMQLSGMVPAVRTPRPQTQPPTNNGNGHTTNSISLHGEEGWWPQGIQQTGPLPVVNLYGRQPFGQTLPQRRSRVRHPRNRSQPGRHCSVIQPLKWCSV